ncbi:MAG: DUF4359 domain-containing protein [Leptolyngbyaceae cyanobacterium]
MALATKHVFSELYALTQKRSFRFAAGGLLIGLIAMMVTNPGKPAYTNYASERLPEELKQGCSELKEDIWVGSVFKLPTGDLCKSLVGGADLVGRSAIKLIIERSTERQNFGIFSIYTTTVPGRTVKTVGIGRRFITFYHE